jgi:iron complex outermembrane receptor protein
VLFNSRASVEFQALKRDRVVNFPKLLMGGICVLAHLAFADVLPTAPAKPARAVTSESDYLSDVPTVISVSRLAQTLDDTPGALTILDRDFIRMTGARSVVEVLRFVPGFQTTSSFESDAPIATYHGRSDDWANRIQVLVDGRSVYSGLLQGSAGIGWQTLALDDIERIEVLRGSNSATYGARAFLGVVNIVSRDVRETTGFAASVTRGENGLADVGMRMGWSAGDGSFRLGADSLGDNGLQGANGINHTERLNLSGHWGLERGADLNVRAGAVGIYAGRGSLLPDQFGNPARMRFQGSQFIQADWRTTLNDSQDLTISASHTENVERDSFAYLDHLVLPVNGLPVDFYGANVDFGSNEYVDTLTAQHTVRFTPTLRGVWGAELRRERIDSRSQFDQLGSISTDFYRLFGSAEWRLSDAWLLNAGALAEHSTIAGDSVSPRIMLNWHLNPGHTLRAGMSTAFRPPSAFEKFGQVQYYDVSGQHATGYFAFNNGTLVSERLFSRELGYHLAPRGAAVSADVRVFSELISDGITATTDLIVPGIQPRTTLNGLDYRIDGVELQADWALSPATRLFLAQTWTTIEIDAAPGGGSTRFRTEHGAPRYAASLTLMHNFAQGLHLSLMHQVADDVALMSISDSRWLFSMQRTDVRLAQDLRIAGKKAELSLVLQNLGEPYQDGDWKYLFNRRALVSLKIEN